VSVREELIRRASEGCEGPLDNPCFRGTLPKHLWCDPCRCQEASKLITSAEAQVTALTEELADLRKISGAVVAAWRDTYGLVSVDVFLELMGKLRAALAPAAASETKAKG